MRLPFLRLAPLLFLLLAVCRADTPPDAALAEATAAVAKNQFLVAERLVEPLTRGRKAHPMALNLLSQVRAAQHRLPEAIKLAERAVKLQPDQAQHHAQLGAVLSRRVNESYGMERSIAADDMRKAYEKAVRLDPNHASALAGLSSYYASAPLDAGGDLAKATELAERLRPLDAALAENQFGMIALRNNDRALALAHFEKASELKPDDVMAQFSCGVVLAQLGRKDEARRRYETALKLNPYHSHARQALARLDDPPAAEPAKK